MPLRLQWQLSQEEFWPGIGGMAGLEPGGPDIFSREDKVKRSPELVTDLFISWILYLKEGVLCTVMHIII